MAATQLTHNLRVEWPQYQHPFINGVQTYQKEFNTIILPAIDKIVTHNRDLFIISFGAFIKPYMLKSEAIIFQILHNTSYQPISKEVGYPISPVFITHYSSLADEFNHRGHLTFYVPMSLDLSSLPVTREKNGKIIYYGNVMPPKEKTFQKLRDKLNMDFISFGKFNGEGPYLSHREALEKVSQYSIGIGVGRCLIEMLGMGLKCIVAGNSYGGALLDQSTLEIHHKSNFNSDLVTSTDIYADVQALTYTDPELDIDSMDVHRTKYCYGLIINTCIDKYPNKK